MSWLADRSYRRSHVITHATNAGTGYQIKIIVHEGNGTTLNNTNEIYCNGLCRSDFNDIRFTKSDGTTKLPYWLETYSNGTAVFWVKITDDLSTTDQTIYVYYDNNSTEPSESTTSTFLAWRDLADDFNAALGTVSLTTYSNPNDPGDYFITPQTVGSVSVNPCIYFRSWGGKKYSVSSNNLYFEGYENGGNYGLCGIDVRNRTSAATAGWQTSMAYVPNTTLSKKHIVVLKYSKAGNDGYLSFHSSWSTNSDDIPEGTIAQGYALTATSQTVTEYSYGGDLSHIRLVSVSGDQLTVYSFIYAIANYVSTEPGDGVWGSEETGSVGEDLEVTGNLTVDGNATINNQLTGSSATFTGLTVTNGIAVASSLGDKINNAPWYGIGYSNVANDNGYYTQLAGYYGLKFKTAYGQINMTLNGGLQLPAQITSHTPYAINNYTWHYSAGIWDPQGIPVSNNSIILQDTDLSHKNPYTNELCQAALTLMVCDNRGEGITPYLDFTSLLTTDAAFLVQRDFTAGGFVASNQGVIALGSGIKRRTDQPRIWLTHSSYPRLQGISEGTTLPTGQQQDGQLFCYTGNTFTYYVNEENNWTCNQNHLLEYHATSQYPHWEDIGALSDFAEYHDTVNILKFDDTFGHLKCGNVKPGVNNTFAIGDSSTIWANGWFKRLSVIDTDPNIPDSEMFIGNAVDSGNCLTFGWFKPTENPSVPGYGYIHLYNSSTKTDCMVFQSNGNVAINNTLWLTNVHADNYYSYDALDDLTLLKNYKIKQAKLKNSDIETDVIDLDTLEFLTERNEDGKKAWSINKSLGFLFGVSKMHLERTERLEQDIAAMRSQINNLTKQGVN